MLSRSLRRAVLDTRIQLPPTFLLPWTAKLSTVSHTTEASNAPEELVNSAHKTSEEKSTRVSQSKFPSTKDLQSAQPLPPPSSKKSPIALSQSIRDLLPILQSQSPHYITAHIHDRPYLLTEGDTLRLPFLMPNVVPGDVLRLNRASNIGSRDLTLKAGALGPKPKSPTARTILATDPTTGTAQSESHIMPGAAPSSSLSSNGAPVDHFVYNELKNRTAYLDERFFVCRAVVMGVESEPLRIKEKTKRRNRKVKKVKSKHRFTILKVKELRIKTLEELEADSA